MRDAATDQSDGEADGEALDAPPDLAEAETEAVPPGTFEHWRLTTDFITEAAAVGDLDGDGHPDLVAGQVWWPGPAFDTRYELDEAPVITPISGYGKVFLCFVDDVNGDGRPDVLAVPSPNMQAVWYENPGGRAVWGLAWQTHPIFMPLGGESPQYVDLLRDGKRRLVFIDTSTLTIGYAEPDADPTQPWLFRPIGKRAYAQFQHGQGVGDIDGDGRLDVLDAKGWWRQLPPASAGGLPAWEQHDFDFALGKQGGAQMRVFDVDGDGKNDVVASLDAHGYGLDWFEQQRSADGTITFVPHEILPAAPSPVSFSEPHNLEIGDINGDGLLDLVAGKRPHADETDPGVDDPPVLYWFELSRSGGVASFTPHLIDDMTGAGLQVAVRDVNGDGRPDVFTASKKGISLHLQK
jgi:hypothetical protein